MSLCSELKDLIQDHMDRHPNVSINALAARSKVGASTLRRIVSGTVKGDPSPHTVLNIVSTVKKEKCLSILLEQSSGEIGELLADCFGQYTTSKAKNELDLDLDELLKDTISYFIYKLAANSAGVCITKIVEMYGTMGNDKLNRLIDAGYIKKSSNMLHATQKNYCTSAETALEHLPTMVKFFKLNEVEMGLNMFYTLSESINHEGVKKVKEIQKEAVTKIHAVLNDSHYQGNIPYFTITMSDTLSMGSTHEVLQ